MKKFSGLLALVLALLLLPFAPKAYAEADSDVVRGIYEALLAEDSSYSETKATYTEYYPETVFEETLADDSFTLSVSGNEYFEGSWTYTLDGEYLVSSFSDEDFTGAMMSQYVLNAVGKYFEMNTALLNGYIIGLNVLGLENNYYIVDDDAENGSTTVRINVSGPYDMKELDEMLLTPSLLDFEPLNDNFSSMGANCGKLSMVSNGSAHGVKILIGEYGGLDELSYQSILNVVKVLQPDGWEDFLADFTELKEIDTEAYTVTLNADEETVAEINEPRENVSYAILRFGEEESYGEWEGDITPTAEAFEFAYFRMLAGLETGTAGSSLRAAEAACDVFSFAAFNGLDNPDIELLRANMLEGFSYLDEDEQAAFWQGFDIVRELLDNCFDDYEANRAVFEDAGVADMMDMLMEDEVYRTAWENLRDHTLTMGNQIAG